MLAVPFASPSTEGLPGKTKIMSKFIVKEKTLWNSDCKEVVLIPEKSASSNSCHGSSNCLVTTIIEVQSDLPGNPSQSATSGYADHGTESVSPSSQNHRMNQVGKDL